MPSFQPKRESWGCMCLTSSLPSFSPSPQLLQQRAERGRRGDHQIPCLSVLRACPRAVAGAGTRELQQCWITWWSDWLDTDTQRHWRATALTGGQEVWLGPEVDESLVCVTRRLTMFLEFSLSLQIVELDVIRVSGDVCWCEPQVLWCVAGWLTCGCQKGLDPASSC